MPLATIPFIAPMKIKFLKSVVLKNKRRPGVVLLSLTCLILAAIPGASQLRNPKRITALLLGDAAEGARVTIVSDSALNDYEAFRRGDRFYVKIPLADFTSFPPQFRADGFEDVQVQKVGDGLIVSFRLQPGASAHVDQRSNRLDVIFSAPNRSLRNAANRSSRVSPGNNVSRTPTGRGPDAAGPVPPNSAFTFPRAGVVNGASELNSGRALRNPRLPVNQSADTSRNANDQATPGNTAVKSPSPLSSPSSLLNPSTTSSYPPLANATPTLAQTPVSAGSTGSSNWKTRRDAAWKWISANRLASLLGGLILLSLIIYLVTALSRRRKNEAKAKRLKAPKVQPKVQPNVQPPTGAVASPQNRTWVLTKPSINSSSAGPAEASEEQEREVFEL